MNMLRASSSTSSTISFNHTTSKYYVHFGGTTVETTVTDRAATASQWVQDVASLYAARGAVVGLNVEYWRPNTTRGVINKSATLQLCVADRCLILQLMYMDEIPDSVKGFLTNPNFMFVGVGVGEDVRKLRADYRLDCCSYQDIRQAAKARLPLKFSRPGLKGLAWELCGLQMMKPKDVRMSNWAIRVLTKAQVEYACIDAFASYKVGHKLFIELKMYKLAVIAETICNLPKVYSTDLPQTKRDKESMNMSRASSSTSSTISFNPTTSKYYVHFGGTTVETTVTDRNATASQWVQDVDSLYAARGAVVGLDVEWRPNTTRGVINKSATLQLCVADRCLVLQLIYMDEIPDSVKGFLANPNFMFVGVEVGDDVQKLRDDYGLDCYRYRDIREAAKARWPLRFKGGGLKELAWEVCGLQMMKPKHASISNWDAWVREEQVEYACIDAFASYKVGHKLFIEMQTYCDELVFDSTKQPRILECGHAMHMECYDAMFSQNPYYRCPICFKSDMNMSTNWMKDFVCLLISLYIVYIFIR